MSMLADYQRMVEKPNLQRLDGIISKLEASHARLEAENKALREACLELLGQFDQAHTALGVDRSSSARAAIERARQALSTEEK